MTFVPFPVQDFDLASGKDLDLIGARHGVIRAMKADTTQGSYNYGAFAREETDAEYRERIRASIKTDEAWKKPNEDKAKEEAKVDPEVERKKKEREFFFPKNKYGCECGAWVIGFVDYGPEHSDGCRLYRKDPPKF